MGSNAFFVSFFDETPAQGSGTSSSSCDPAEGAVTDEDDGNDEDDENDEDDDNDEDDENGDDLPDSGADDDDDVGDADQALDQQISKASTEFFNRYLCLFICPHYQLSGGLDFLTTALAAALSMGNALPL